MPECPAEPQAPENRMVVLEALATLPPGPRAVVVLRFWEDLSVERAAAVLGCSPGTVKSHTARALRKLRAVLGETMAGYGAVGCGAEVDHEVGDARDG